jgi:hypothetical protein
MFMVRRGLAIVAGLEFLSGPGCAGSECGDPQPYPDYSVAGFTAGPSDGEMAYEWNGSGLLSAPFGDPPSADLPLRGCYLDVSTTRNSGVEVGQPVSESAVLRMTCSGGTGYDFWLTFSLGDLRNVGVGSYAPGSPRVSYPEVNASETICSGSVPASGVRVVVEEAVGGPAPYPEVVTPDYRRVVRVDFNYDTPQYADGDGDAGVCIASVRVVGHVRYTVVAADYRTDPDGTIRYC